MELRPLLITRVANMAPGSVLTGLGVRWWFAGTGDLHFVDGAVLAALGVVIAIRGFRLGVRYDGETVTVRGMLRSREIQRASIREITAFPAVKWSGKSGRRVWTPIIAFAEFGTVIAPVAKRNEQAIKKLQRWHRRRRQ